MRFLTKRKGLGLGVEADSDAKDNVMQFFRHRNQPEKVNKSG
jgi:hypothetical protein